MGDLDVKVIDKKFQKLVKRLPKTAAQEISLGLLTFLRKFEARMMIDRLSGRPGLMVQTGALRASMKTEVKGATLKTIEGRASIGGRKTPYARIQEEGGVVKPKRAKMLKVPMDDAKTAGGRVKAEYLRPGKNPNLALTYRTVQGRRLPFLAERSQSSRGRDAQGKFMKAKADKNAKLIFRLVPQVTIPARLGFVATLRERWRTMRYFVIQGIVKRIAERENRA